jgi:hypothetical protein
VIATYLKEPRCDLCGDGVLNSGRPAQPAGNGGYAHVACVEDRCYDQLRERESLIEGREL